MRLKEEEITRIIANVLKNLKDKKLVTFKAPEDKVKNTMVDIFRNNLEQEDRLDEEVEEILKKFQDQIDSGQVDYRKMFYKVKKELARERNIVL